ncbi:MAG: aminotransferase class I/II-fold pyridoxal phosphate-dependent enzyme [Promethearchaeota archaeon]|nr:MAG: aminotransferase class I/II-fold pyridoxal phosphate-dependent enzyme [Candidatus Lokiarchaeota archaeon]
MKVRKVFDSSPRVKSIEYAIRDVVGVAQQLEKQGKKITYLSIGDPPKYDFDTPQHIKDALLEAVKGGQNLYVDSMGIPELREAIVEKALRNRISLSKDEILITSGVSEGILFILAALIGVTKQDEFLIPGPSYPPWFSYTKFFEGLPIEYKMDEENNWQPDIDDIRRRISNNTRGILILSPNNPVGVVYTERNLLEIIDLAGEHNLPIVTDEIYEHIIYDRPFISVASLSKDVPVIGLNGFSKAYLMTGWRLGYIYYHDPEGYLEQIQEDIKRMARVRLCAPGPTQLAAVEALRGPQDHIPRMVAKLRERRDYTCKRLNDIEGIDCKVPQGAFYVFPRVELGERWNNDKEFVIDFLNKKQVLFVYGSGFGPKYGSSHFRVVYLAPIPILEEAFDKLEDFMKE